MSETKEQFMDSMRQWGRVRGVWPMRYPCAIDHPDDATIVAQSGGFHFHQFKSILHAEQWASTVDALTVGR